MDILHAKFSTYARGLPPQPARLTNPPWGAAEPTSGPMLPFVRASQYGLELIYPYDAECHVVGANGTIFFQWDFAKEPGVTGGEFRAFSPVQASQYYLINTRMDLQTPPGYVVRTEPHPRFYTDDSGTVPLTMIGHLQMEWYPRLLFIVFRGPRQGQRHIFRKGEPFAQILIVPQHLKQERSREGRDQAASHPEAGETPAQTVKLKHLPIRMTNVTWAGSSEKMEDGSEPQPWHCLPFVEGSTYGVELFYPFETECQVVNADGAIRFEGNHAPDGAFAVLEDPRFYRLNAPIDLKPQAGFACRIEPHPRYFTDNSAMAPLPLVGHLLGSDQAGAGSIIFRSPRSGERHVFRKGEPIAQVIFVPEPMQVAIERMTLEEAAERRELEDAIESSRLDIADHVWRNRAGYAFNNHYKLLARAFARGGLPGVKEVVHKAVEARERAIPKNLTIPELMALGLQRLREQKFEQAEQIFIDILSRDPNNARAHSALGICYDSLGNMTNALRFMTQAVALQPGSANYHANLGELLRRLDRFKEAEASFRSALFITPNDLDFLCALGLVLSQQGNQAEARKYFETALAIDPNYAPAGQALQNLPN